MNAYHSLRTRIAEADRRKVVGVVGVLLLALVVGIAVCNLLLPPPLAPITPVPLTSTPTATDVPPTHIPSPTLTETATWTAIPPTLTPTFTPSLTATATHLPPTLTATPSPSPSPTPTLPTVPAGHSQITPPPQTLPETGDTLGQDSFHLKLNESLWIVCDAGERLMLEDGKSMYLMCVHVTRTRGLDAW